MNGKVSPGYPEVFSTLNHLPDPIPNGDHYEEFESIYGSQTDENFWPSLVETKRKPWHAFFANSTVCKENWSGSTMRRVWEMEDVL